MKEIKKKQWSRPECVKGKLVPEEAVLWGCKTYGSSVSKDGLWGTCITFATCPTQAS